MASRPTRKWRARAQRLEQQAEAMATAWDEYIHVMYLRNELPTEMVTDWAQGVLDHEAAMRNAVADFRKL